MKEEIEEEIKNASKIIEFNSTDLDNLITEIATMIESGTIRVGALGLSQDSADYVNHYDDVQEAIGSSVPEHSDLKERAETFLK